MLFTHPQRTLSYRNYDSNDPCCHYQNKTAISEVLMEWKLFIGIIEWSTINKATGIWLARYQESWTSPQFPLWYESSEEWWCDEMVLESDSNLEKEGESMESCRDPTHRTEVVSMSVANRNKQQSQCILKLLFSPLTSWINRSQRGKEKTIIYTDGRFESLWIDSSDIGNNRTWRLKWNSVKEAIFTKLNAIGR